MTFNEQQIAYERINILYEKALEIMLENPELARRYIRLMKKIAQRSRKHIPKEIKDNICKQCNTILIPGYSCHTRIRQRRESHIATTCHHCGHIKRLPIRKERK